MSKKDYQAIARALYMDRADFQGVLSDAPPIEVARIIAERIADTLAADNPRFDRARFIEACETGGCKGMPKRRTAAPDTNDPLASGVDRMLARQRAGY